VQVQQIFQQKNHHVESYVDSHLRYTYGKKCLKLNVSIKYSNHYQLIHFNEISFLFIIKLSTVILSNFRKTRTKSYRIGYLLKFREKEATNQTVEYISNKNKKLKFWNKN
jgi:hypothetical protein